jgi:LPS export ABC transporter protein LptC
MLHKKYLWLIPVSLVLTGILFSCANDIEKIKQVTQTEDLPDEVSTHLTMVSTDSGYVKYVLKGAIVESYRIPVPKTVIKDGLEVSFYDKSTGELEAVLTSYYGEREPEADRMFVRDSVVLKNINKNQQLETEELHWRNDSVFSNKAVIVKTEDAILWGKGIVADQTFDKFEILYPTGEKKLNN